MWKHVNKSTITILINYLKTNDGSGTPIFVQMHHTYETNITSSICILISYYYTNRSQIEEYSSTKEDWVSLGKLGMLGWKCKIGYT